MALASLASVADQPPATIAWLLSQGRKAEGRRVVLEVFVTMEFEGSHVCDLRQPRIRYRECLSFDIDSGPWETQADSDRYSAAWESWKKLQGKRVRLEAMFVAEPGGHFGMWPGTLEQPRLLATIDG